MRDPLRRFSVRSKLALGFVGLCTIAYGLGGALISSTAGSTLEAEIVKRLEFQCQAYAAALQGRLEMLTRRTEDFASDGHVRGLLASLSDPAIDSATAEKLRSEMHRHLRVNKLPLEAAFTDLSVHSTDARIEIAVDPERAGERLAATADSLTRSGSWVSDVDPGREGDPPSLVIATPIRDLESGVVIGQLRANVRAGVWVAALMRTDERVRDRTAEDVSLRLFDASGVGIVVPARFLNYDDSEGVTESVRNGLGLAVFSAPPVGGDAVPKGDKVFLKRYPIGTSGWEAEIRIQSARTEATLSALQTEFLLLGAVLVLASTLLIYFPIRFLVRPLGLLSEAALRIRSGDFSTRVDEDSEDELGDLGKSFNLMATAVQTRTAELEHAAEDLLQRQQEVLAQRDRLDHVISAMYDDLVLLRSDGKVLLCNHPDGALMDALDDRSKEPMVVERSCPENARRTGRGCAACLSATHKGAVTCTMEAGGKVLEVHASSMPVNGDLGRIIVARDVTDRTAREEREIHQERLAVLGEVAAVMAHELNNPLASISMFNQMLGTSLDEDSPLQESVEVIGRNTETCKKVIRELLGYSAAMDREIAEVDVHDILEDATRFLRPLADRSGVELRLAPAASRSIVRGDEVQLRQVFVNLVMNAVQANRSGGTVVLSTCDLDGQLIVDVRDTGCGIPADDREQVFRPFFTTKARGEGTGLGLPTAQRIVEMNGGAIELLNSSAAGTTFRVRLRPVVAAEVLA